MTDAAGPGGAGETPDAAPPRVLVVDDEPLVTNAVARVLRRTFDVATATSAAVALDLVRRGPPFAVVISDYQMPGMDGGTFLQHVRQIAPDTVRVLLTGRSDLSTAVAAVNRGQIFRFVAKPPTSDQLLAVVGLASEQYRRAVAEREVLEQTLHGSVKALVSLLALVRPVALGRTGRLKRRASAVAVRLGVADRWALEVAALLSQVGCVTLPEATARRLAEGAPLADEERALVARLPGIAESLVADIPRMEAVREILRHQDTAFDGAGSPEPDVAGEAIPLGARILTAVIDYDALETGGTAPGEALATMAARAGRYDPAVLDALRDLELHAEAPAAAAPRQVAVSQLRVGMALAEDLVAPDGTLVVARGQEVTSTLVERARHEWAEWAAGRAVAVTLPTT